MLDVNEPLIGIVAGSMREVAQWREGNIVPITSHDQYERIRGIKLDHVFEVGTWYEWAGQSTLNMIQALAHNKRR
jgi:hypothetical protein